MYVLSAANETQPHQTDIIKQVNSLEKEKKTRKQHTNIQMVSWYVLQEKQDNISQEISSVRPVYLNPKRLSLSFVVCHHLWPKVWHVAPQQIIVSIMEFTQMWQLDSPFSFWCVSLPVSHLSFCVSFFVSSALENKNNHKNKTAGRSHECIKSAGDLLKRNDGVQETVSSVKNHSALLSRCYRAGTVTCALCCRHHWILSVVFQEQRVLINCAPSSACRLIKPEPLLDMAIILPVRHKSRSLNEISCWSVCSTSKVTWYICSDEEWRVIVSNLRWIYSSVWKDDAALRATHSHFDVWINGV